MGFNDQIRASRERYDDELVPVVPALPTKEANAQWAKWLNNHKSCKFSDKEINIITGRAKNGDMPYEFRMYSIKRSALKREGVVS